MGERKWNLPPHIWSDSRYLGSGIGTGKDALERVTDLPADDRNFLRKMQYLLEIEAPGSEIPIEDRRRYERLTGRMIVDYDDPEDEVHYREHSYYHLPSRRGKKMLDPSHKGKTLGELGLGKYRYPSTKHGGKIKKKPANRYARGGKVYTYAGGPRKVKI